MAMVTAKYIAITSISSHKRASVYAAASHREVILVLLLIHPRLLNPIYAK
jgi:hypothetical protein